MKIDHVGIVVQDLDKALATYASHFGFAAGTTRGGDVPAPGIENAVMPVDETDLELIQAVSTERPVATLGERAGEGTFMLSIVVDAIEAGVAHLRGLRARAGDPRNGLALSR